MREAEKEIETKVEEAETSESTYTKLVWPSIVNLLSIHHYKRNGLEKICEQIFP